MNEQRTIVIPAAVGSNPGIVREPVSARYYATITAASVFKLRVNGAEIEQGPGRTYGSAESPEYNSLTFLNYTAAALQVVYYFGNVPYQPDPTTNATIGNVSVNVSGTTKNAPTYTKGTNQAIASGAALPFTGLDVGGQVRKSFSVFNNHAADDLYVRGANGTLMHIVPARTGYPVEAGGAITLYVPGANAITVAVSEVFYS